MKIHGKYRITKVDPKLEDDGKSTGRLLCAITASGTMPVDEMLDMIDKQADRDRFKAKYWRDGGKLLVDKLQDSAKLSAKLLGCVTVFASVVGEKELHRFEAVNVKGVKIKPEPGRTVEVKFTMNLYPGTEDKGGALMFLLGHEVVITAERQQAEMELETKDGPPISAGEQAPLNGTDAAPEAKKPLPGRKPPQQPKSVRDAAAKAGAASGKPAPSFALN